MNVLGIDPAQRSGFYHSDGFFVAENCYRYGDHPGVPLIRLANFIREILKKHPTDLIAAEDASFGSHNPAKQAEHNERKGVIKVVAAEFKIDVKFFGPKSVKCFATNYGHATKQQMMKACNTFYGLNIHDEDIADAFWVMQYAQRPDCWSVPAPKKKRRGKILPPTKRYTPRLWRK